MEKGLCYGFLRRKCANKRENKCEELMKGPLRLGHLRQSEKKDLNNLWEMQNEYTTRLKPQDGSMGDPGYDGAEIHAKVLRPFL